MTSWDRQLWGVEFSSSFDPERLLLGEGWHDWRRPPSYAGEPTGVLLFTTRRTARVWCESKAAEYAGRTDSCASWRFRPIRVRETVRPLGGARRRRT